MRISTDRKYKKQAELKNIITDIITIGINSRLDYTKEQLSNLEDRIVKIT